jgi:hypothetical protein
LVALSFIGGDREVKHLYEGDVPAAHEHQRAALASASADVARDQEKIADIDRQVAALDKMSEDAVAGAAKRGKVVGARNLMDAQAKRRADLSAQRLRAVENLAAMKTQESAIRSDLAVGRLDPGPLAQYAHMAGWQIDDESALEFWLMLVVISFGPAAAWCCRRGRREDPTYPGTAV